MRRLACNSPSSVGSPLKLWFSEIGYFLVIFSDIQKILVWKKLFKFIAPRNYIKITYFSFMENITVTSIFILF